MEISYHKTIPGVPEYVALRESAGWPIPEDEDINTGLDNSVFCIIAKIENEVIGMARIVGDFGFIYFIVDVIVLPDYQGKGIGSNLMQEVMLYLKANAPKNSYITLMSAKGRENFYEKYGFFKRPNEKFGCGMMVEFENK